MPWPLSRGSVRHVTDRIAPLAFWLLTGHDGCNRGGRLRFPRPGGVGARAMSMIDLFPLFSTRGRSDLALWFETCASYACPCPLIRSAGARRLPSPVLGWVHLQHVCLCFDDMFGLCFLPLGHEENPFLSE